MRSNSPCDILCGSQMMPPLAPPNGIFTTAHFHVIQLASARTSSRVTSGAYRIPPLHGPRAIECCTRKPVNTSICPLSRATGKCTITSRDGERRTFHSPSSRLSLRAAKSKRALCASQGLISWSKVKLVVPVAMVFSPSLAVLHFLAAERVSVPKSILTCVSLCRKPRNFLLCSCLPPRVSSQRSLSSATFVMLRPEG